MKKQTVLETLAQAARIRTEQHKIRLPESRLEQLTNTAPRHLPPFAFEQALGTGRLAVIAEVKKPARPKASSMKRFRMGISPGTMKLPAPTASPS